MIQEFNTTIDTHQWVTQTFGSGYQFAKESGAGLPNGIVSRFPIVAHGEWDDTTQTNRDYAWAKIRLPNGQFLWAISVHLKASNASAQRRQEAQELVTQIRASIPPADYMVLGGDFNTSNRNEPCVTKLAEVFRTGAPFPEDQGGNGQTNSSRGTPYDWVLADAELHPRQVATRIGPDTFASGAVVDTRRFTPLPAIAPATTGDSGAPNMQHMAVVKDYLIP
jgi:endonuclease/exonuclease/phosphatase family metal-dependent hydrolase